MIWRKPHQKSAHKSVRKIQSEQMVKKQQPKKFVAKPAPNMTKTPKIPVRQKNNPANNANNNKNVPKKVQQLQKMVQKIQNIKGNEEMQEMLLKQIRGIKSQLRQIKSQMGMKSHPQHNNEYEHNNEQFHSHNQRDQNEEENIMNFNSHNNGSQLRQIPVHNNRVNSQEESGVIMNRPKIKSVVPGRSKHKKVLLDIGKIQPYMKQFKLQNTSNKIPQPFYHGYHKKSSKPIMVKYCQETKNMDFVTGMYQRLWKNIVKAKNICINKIYDINEPLATNILVIEQNKCGLQGIEMNPFKISQEILKALQFFHQCGYLYRNMHPQHVMLSYENNIVLLDLKKMKKFVDIKGKVIDLKGNQEDEELEQFISNSRIRNSIQGRKDDLQCLGYLTLYMLEGRLPWNSENMIQVRSKMLLNQIFGKYPGLLKFMIEVNKLPTHDVPNYNMFLELLNP